MRKSPTNVKSPIGKADEDDSVNNLMRREDWRLDDEPESGRIYVPEDEQDFKLLIF